VIVNGNIFVGWAGLDRANHVEVVAENRFYAHVGDLTDGQKSKRLHSWLLR
jgi:hypothetical protein